MNKKTGSCLFTVVTQYTIFYFTKILLLSPQKKKIEQANDPPFFPLKLKTPKVKWLKLFLIVSNFYKTRNTWG